MQKIDRFLRLMNDRSASDFHLTVGRPPMVRASGTMETIRYRMISEADFTELVQPVTPPSLWEAFVATGDVDYSYEIPGLSRYRVNLFRQQRGAGAVFRVIPTKIMTLEQLGLPDQVRRIASIRSGLVLVTGPTGSGKSTTLAAIIDLINETRSLHIITIEDPIEFVHPNKKCLIHQREIGTHAKSFAEALKAAGREDPDLILVGEMRDLDTIAMALSAAERGTLVFGTLHTNNAAKTMDRIISVFRRTGRHPQRPRRNDPRRGRATTPPADRRRPRRRPRNPVQLPGHRQHDPRRQDPADHVSDSNRHARGNGGHGHVDPAPVRSEAHHGTRSVRQGDRQGAVQGFGGGVKRPLTPSPAARETVRAPRTFGVTTSQDHGARSKVGSRGLRNCTPSTRRACSKSSVKIVGI
jgi:twitching motility protein PilT